MAGLRRLLGSACLTGLCLFSFGASGAPAWTPERLAELDRLIAASHEDGLEPGDYATVSRSPQAALELLYCHLRFGKVDLALGEARWNCSGLEVDGEPLPDKVARAVDEGRVEALLTAARPTHWMYAHGRDWLARHRDWQAEGPWPVVGAGITLEPGAVDERVPILRERLRRSGDLARDILDAGNFYGPALVSAVRRFQARHRLEVDGRVGRATLAELNVSLPARIRQLRINLDRARNLLHEIRDEDVVVVDIAGFELRYLRDRERILTSRVQVGRTYRQTPEFISRITEIILNPSWTVPPTILAEDILPQLRRDPTHLQSLGLEVLDLQGRPVDQAAIDWSRYRGDQVPYVLRQPPGPGNALGRIKFVFPNPYLVFLHQTPATALFERDRRTFSSGCIRVEWPFELAARLLGDPGQDAASLLALAEASEGTQSIRLKRPVRLILAYWTVDEDPGGVLVFKPDVYGRDEGVWRALSAPPPGKTSGVP